MSKATRIARFGTRIPGSFARREARIALEEGCNNRGPDAYAYRFTHFYSKTELDEHGNPKITSTVEVRVWADGRTKVTACDPSGRPLPAKKRLKLKG